MIVFILIVVLIGFLLFATETGKELLSSESIAKSKPESIQETGFFCVYLDEIETDHKTIISMNEDESKYEKEYIYRGSIR